MWDRGTVHFGLLNYVIYIPSQFNTCHDPFFTSLQMVCLDEIDNYVEIVSISCMACTDLHCRKHDTGYPRTNVSIYVQRERRSEDDMMEDDWFLPYIGGQPLQKFFAYHMEEAKKCAQQPSNRPQKNGYYPPDFPEKIANNCSPLSLLWSSVMLGKCTMQVSTFSWWFCGIAN